MEACSITVGEMPSHNHSASSNTAGSHTHVVRQANALGAGNGLIIGVYNTSSSQTVSSSGSHSHAITINNSGSNSTHNNMQPYLSVYIWKRTT